MSATTQAAASPQMHDSSSVCNDPRQVFSALLTERPAFHGQDELVNLNLMDAVQQWMFDTIQDGWVTLETGCGYSTVIAGLRGACHTVISPFVEEHQRIKDWLMKHDVRTDRLNFIADTSESVLPNHMCPPLDLVLIDGRHAFPTPFIDWYYTAEKLKLGGYVMVDDTQIRACGILRDFLTDEQKADRWEKVTTIYRTAIFRKIHERVHHNIWWGMQPWGLKANSLRDVARHVFDATLKQTIGRSPRLKQAAHTIYSKLRNKH